MSKVGTFWSYVKLGLEMGADARSRWVLATMLLRLRILRALSIPDEQVWQISLRLTTHCIPFYFRAQDIFIVHEILVDNPYIPNWLRDEPLKRIADLGAHIGLATLQFKAHFPDAIINCYEADPDNFRLLELNMKYFNDIILNREAVGDISGDGVFYVQQQRHTASSLVKPKDSVKVIEVRCPVRSLDDILTKMGSADLIKFDIEGIEYDVFATSHLAQKVRFIVGEMKATEEEVKRFLALFPHHEAHVKTVTARMHLVYLRRP